MFEEKFTEFVTLHSRRAPLSDNEAAVVRHSCRAVAAASCTRLTAVRALSA